MKILVTGSAGFIGSALTLRLLEKSYIVVGIDNHNDYYNPKLKEARLARHIHHPNYFHAKVDISDKSAVQEVFSQYKPHKVVHLAAQAGVRHSMDNPSACIDTNIVGFSNVLECCRQYSIKHLVYASSSSVYGTNNKTPFSTQDRTDHPISLYAASKKSNELMAHTYSHLYNLPTTGLRFFTVYGPWGRPDMLPFKFAKAVFSEKPLKVFNYGNHQRDFTYIDDVVEGVIRVLEKSISSTSTPWHLYNIGNSAPTKLLDYITALEAAFGKTADKEFLPLQLGDVQNTYANIDELVERFDYQPNTPISEGVKHFANWYLEYYQ